MKKIIVLTSCRNRLEYLDAYINHLDEIAEGYDITVYIAGFEVELPGERFAKYERNNITYYKINTLMLDMQTFRKGQIYNFLQYFTREVKCDYLCFWDCDLVINPEVLGMMENGKDDIALILGGLKLTFDATKEIMLNKITTEEIFDMDISSGSQEDNKRHFYIGNICLPINVLKAIRSILKKDQIYDDRFMGFGGEDNVVYNLIKQMSKKKLITYKYIDNGWRHLYHERQCNKDKEQYEKNVKLMNKINDENEAKVKAYGISNV